MRHAFAVTSLLCFLPLGAHAAVSPLDVAEIAPRAVAHNAPVVISGTGFGAKRHGEVRIGGQRAWVTQWSDTRIVAYVPDAAADGHNPVELVAGGYAVSGPALDVQSRPRPPVRTGVAWRFEVLANYISHRAAVGRDGTVYFNDSSGFLYALTPAGALKWVYDGQGAGSQGPTVVGSDGTIYYGTATLSAVHAVNPDGSRKWIYQAPESQGLIGGPGIGPDGNVYAVFDVPGAIGAVSLTPAGALRWSKPGNPRVAEYGQLGRELVFGGGNVYFTSSYYGQLWAFSQAAGAQRFHADVSTAGQGDAARDGTVYVPTQLNSRLLAYSKTGQVQWSFFGDLPNVTNDLSAVELGGDGSLYTIRNLGELYALTPGAVQPTVRWVAPSLLPTGALNGPAVSPKDDLVLLGGQATYGEPGLVQGFAAADGTQLFQLPLPKEPDGTCAVPYARAAFVPAGNRAYLPAVQLCIAPQQYHAWLYAVDIGAR